MPGFIYLFILWNIWIYTTFILDKNHKARYMIAMFVLILIIAIPHTLSFYYIKMSGSAFILLLISYIISTQYCKKSQFYFIFSFITISFGYAGVLFFEMYDPVWVFVERQVLLPFLLFFGAYLLYPSSFPSRWLVVCLGIIQGELLFAMGIQQWKMPFIIGSRDTLDILAITVSALSVIEYLSRMTKLLKSTLEKKMLH